MIPVTIVNIFITTDGQSVLKTNKDLDETDCHNTGLDKQKYLSVKL